MSPIYLHIGGVVAVGFDPTGQFLLVVSHSGLGVFETRAWSKVARDEKLSYPEGGFIDGIGPLQGERVEVTEIDYDTGTLALAGPTGEYSVSYTEGIVMVTPTIV